ncbi:mucin-2-like [Neolamprologus brichardi]|uniref:mucin-2-like n=1 Tax=Neolamprologus brichardi TaxID=32507 RepID=UPI001643C86F|nr:mucin-2-like [Neolamprologus brichardi]
MSSLRWIVTVCFILSSDTCRTFGSGVVEPFKDSAFYVRSNCPFTLTHFIHNRVECDITIRRGNSGLLVQVEIIINKVRTVLQNGRILVEDKSVSFPYDHTYQHIFQYGIYTKLRSTLLPLSVTWHSVAGGIDTLKVELEQELSTDMTGLCGKCNVTGNEQQLIRESALTDDTCQTRDPVSVPNPVCEQFFSYTLGCLQSSRLHYFQLCHKNIYGYENSEHIGCAFFKEIVLHCGKSSNVWEKWRSVTQCARPTCPGALLYEEEGAAFVPTCSNPNPHFSSQDITSSCVCPEGKVLNDHLDGFHCVNVSNCTCVFAGRTYLTGQKRSTKCQSCLCEGGKWRCSENCPIKCQIEGQFVSTFDGKQYTVPGKCTYLALQGFNWTVIITFSKKDPSIQAVFLQHLQETYTFTNNKAKVGDQEISELYQADGAQVFWQSSMYIQVLTSSDIKLQLQMSPEIQLYISAPRKHKGIISGLCGNGNSDSTDDFTSSSGIIELTAEPFALSWSLGACTVNIPSTCINTHNEIFADEKCSVLINATAIFAKCHVHLPPDQYYAACIQRTCNCGNDVQRCLCIALDSYAKACASLGVLIGDWRKAANCTPTCPKNQEFFYNIRACNSTCRSITESDPRCGVDDASVEGCGCPEGTYQNQGNTCTPKADCECHHRGGVSPPGPVVIDGHHCLCENGELTCSTDCGCRNGKVCVHCSEHPIQTAQKTCASLSKPLFAIIACESGCYCPHDQYEDHHGNCVSRDDCTCVYSGKVFRAGETVKTNCKKCVCGQGQWDCKDEPCPGTCQVYGNGHYQTFDAKWYRFSGHCQYTLVEDYCGNTKGTFSVRVERVPCCEKVLTCSRSIVLVLQGKVTVTLSDMKVTKNLQQDSTMQENSLYSIDTVGLYVIVSVPSSGITLIWDKHTRLTIKLHENWRSKVCGLCGNFDSNEMNDLQISGSAVGSSPMAFGNSWKAATPPCSDVTADIFPCDRNSYCSAWAQRRCMIIKGDTFKDCHIKVNPDPYYQACLLESCSCEFEGKFLGYCTAVAAYAEACSGQDVCVKWRTPDLCPIYCDYYNKPGQNVWHYEVCGKMRSCGKRNDIAYKLEGCYPRCPNEAPYYDHNTGECTTVSNCSCYFNATVVHPGQLVMLNSSACRCENGAINCHRPPPSTNTPANTSTNVKTTALITSETSVHLKTTTPVIPTNNFPVTTETWSTITFTLTATTGAATSLTPLSPATGTEKVTTNTTSATKTRSTLPTTTPTSLTTTENVSTMSSTTTVPMITSAATSTSELPKETNTTATTSSRITSSTTRMSSTSSVAAATTDSRSSKGPTTVGAGSTQTKSSTSQVCECVDFKKNKRWACSETWTEDCYHKTCVSGKIVLTPVTCPEPKIPTCPRDQITKVSEGCCETWKCDCQCELYGDPHYISFQGVDFDFLNQGTYILMEEQSPRHNLTIVVDNFHCVPGFYGSCVKGIILKYQNNVATLTIVPHLFSVQATLNNVIIQPPYEEHGFRFETTWYKMVIHLPEIRSFVSLTPFYTLVVSLAMEHFLQNTQGQCGVCGGASCIRKGGQIEEDSCCDKTSYDWVYPDPLKPADVFAPRDVPCHSKQTFVPTNRPPTCFPSPLCELLHDAVFETCSKYVNLTFKKKNCEFDSCGNPNASCSALEQTAEECKHAGFCVDWRRLTNGSCAVPCPGGLVYRECHNKHDDFCYGGVPHPGTSLEMNTGGCFCPRNLFRAGTHSHICVADCAYCKGPRGEPKLPGEVWVSNCNLCTCNNQTRTEECFPKPPKPVPLCGPGEVLVTTSCCGDQMCGKNEHFIIFHHHV